MQYWRIANIGADLFLKLTIEGMPLYVVATDGHYLRRPTRMDEVLLGPGSRIEAVVIGGAPGRYVFKSMSFLLEESQPPLPEHDLGVVVSEGPPADTAGAEAHGVPITFIYLLSLLLSVCCTGCGIGKPPVMTLEQWQAEDDRVRSRP